jgi:hypothetical protein
MAEIERSPAMSGNDDNGDSKGTPGMKAGSGSTVPATPLLRFVSSATA